MVENFGNIFYLILFLLNLAGLGFYGYLTVFNPQQIINDYEIGENAIGIVRIVGTFVWPYLIIGVILLFRGVDGAWIFFVSGLLISVFQLAYDIGSRMKMIDSNHKVINKTQDTAISIFFIVSNVLLINGLADKIYL
jgi:hypothetical protein|tara:strand:- start:3652 stop:4062 length:411 start_codon:yes stop_codon:yes gene_type:complete